jgi:hypothetical protein
MQDEDIFSDISLIIRRALEKSHQKNNSRTGIAQTSFEIALNQLL